MIYWNFLGATGFSPRNGEVILKQCGDCTKRDQTRFSPRNGEVILKNVKELTNKYFLCFSPRNGEVILKNNFRRCQLEWRVSVPVMGK